MQTARGPLRLIDAGSAAVHRVGYAPDPWAWTPWQYAHDGRFDGRWDDPDGLWRTLYVGSSRLACYLEVLAVFRPDVTLQDALDQISDDEPNAGDPPAPTAGAVPASWLTPRQVGAARLAGWYAQPGSRQSLPTLRRQFLALARQLGLVDVDAAAIRLAQPRALTQQIARWLYGQSGPDRQPLAGVQFASRHGDDLALWATFERAGDRSTSAVLTDTTAHRIDQDDPELTQAMHTHQLTWT